MNSKKSVVGINEAYKQLMRKKDHGYSTESLESDDHCRIDENEQTEGMNGSYKKPSSNKESIDSIDGLNSDKSSDTFICGTCSFTTFNLEAFMDHRKNPCDMIFKKPEDSNGDAKFDANRSFRARTNSIGSSVFDGNRSFRERCMYELSGRHDSFLSETLENNQEFKMIYPLSPHTKRNSTYQLRDLEKSWHRRTPNRETDYSGNHE
ncbi:hypothetical protein DdX_06547 [Ditylenchus destructor]|uniref:Uncharacterized protein n=1 Tax=Ditylenchus destructor TaxID=166010 RepID=A0AAD4R8W2_9BILA|nr:hypothetical protein DdX_06547 [Ditylenchus destructor]